MHSSARMELDARVTQTAQTLHGAQLHFLGAERLRGVGRRVAHIMPWSSLSSVDA